VSLKLKENTRLNGRYRVRGKLGEGWEGETYLVRDRLDGRFKALKIITNESRRKSLLSQARVQVRLQHPNIIDYYNVDSLTLGDETYYFLLLEYLQGPRLSQVVAKHFRRRKDPPVFSMLRIFYQICRGMAYVHDRRLLHDDLHTDNIILEGDVSAPVPKLFDFWGSRGGNATEQRAFDIRCAGQVLFECMTGRENYQPKRLVKLPREIQDIIRRTHARVHTYANFHEILRDLEELRDWD